MIAKWKSNTISLLPPDKCRYRSLWMNTVLLSESMSDQLKTINDYRCIKVLKNHTIKFTLLLR